MNQKKKRKRENIFNLTFYQVEGSDQVHAEETETMISDADHPVEISNIYTYKDEQVNLNKMERVGIYINLVKSNQNEASSFILLLPFLIMMFPLKNRYFAL